MNSYKWIDLEDMSYHIFIDNEEGSILTITENEFNSSELPDKTKEANMEFI